jgi:hypothetical protein
LTVSALFGALKWADDFENGLAGSKPVTMVEVCSKLHRRTSIFEEGKYLKKFFVNHSQF